MMEEFDHFNGVPLRCEEKEGSDGGGKMVVVHFISMSNGWDCRYR